MEDKQTRAIHRQAAKDFMAEVQKKDYSLDKIAKIMEDNPDLLSSKEFLKQVFPKRNKEKGTLGCENVSKMVKTIKALKLLQEAGNLSEQQLNDFMNSRSPQTQETFATCVAMNAVYAYDKANVDRSPNDNLSPEARAAFSKQVDVYGSALNDLKELGVSMDIKDAHGHNVEDIAKLGKIKDEKGVSPAIDSAIYQNNTQSTDASKDIDDDVLEVGGEDKPLEIQIDDKALTVKVDEKAKPKDIEDEENIADVEEAPEPDKSGNKDIQWDKIKEQDIIQFMYNEWFLAGLDWGLKKIVGSVENAVDNLCEDHIRHYRKHKKDVKANKNKNATTACNKGKNILSNMPRNMYQQFVNNLEGQDSYFSRMHQDVLDNVGKDPQTWNVLDPNNPKDKKFIDNINSRYAENPQTLANDLNSIQDRMNIEGNAAKRVYKIALEMATTQYMSKNLDKKHADFINDSDERVQKDILKLAQQNFHTLTIGVNSMAEHTRLDCMAHGENDPEIIKSSIGKNISKYLELAEQQAAKAKAAVTMEVENGNFKCNNQRRAFNSTEEVNNINKFLINSERAGELLTEGRKEAGLLSMDQAAKAWNVEAIATNNTQAFIASQQSYNDAALEANKKRKNNFKMTKDKILGAKYFEQYNDNNNVFMSILRESRGAR